MKLLIVTDLPVIMCMTENWLSNEVPDEFLYLYYFVIFRKYADDVYDAHGGVLIAVNSKLGPIAISIVTDLEVFNLNISGLTFTPGVVKRPRLLIEVITKQCKTS